jgi:hypothetical protein
LLAAAIVGCGGGGGSDGPKRSQEVRGVTFVLSGRTLTVDAPPKAHPLPNLVRDRNGTGWCRSRSGYVTQAPGRFSHTGDRLEVTLDRDVSSDVERCGFRLDLSPIELSAEFAPSPGEKPTVIEGEKPDEEQARALAPPGAKVWRVVLNGYRGLVLLGTPPRHITRIDVEKVNGTWRRFNPYRR